MEGSGGTSTQPPSEMAGGCPPIRMFSGTGPAQRADPSRQGSSPWNGEGPVAADVGVQVMGDTLINVLN